MSGSFCIGEAVALVAPPRRALPGDVRAHLDALAKPPGSLGRLEEMAVRLACIAGLPPGPLARRHVLVFAADHGVAARGVSAYPAEVTRAMCGVIASGRAAVSALARAAGAEVTVVDVGVDAPEKVAGVLDRRVRRGTRDLSAEPALTPDEVARALQVGWGMAREVGARADVLALGEMGIGNTTAAAAVTAALTGAPPHAVVGAGTGVTGDALGRKLAAVEAGVARLGGRTAPLDVLAEVGGLEIAALAGATLGGASLGLPVVTDGFIATAGVLAAVRLAPAAAGYVFASHRSAEPGHAVQLAALGLEPPLELALRLGEGTGAVLALPLLDAAGAVLREMAKLAEVLGG